jgi:hypothetical protein
VSALPPEQPVITPKVSITLTSSAKILFKSLILSKKIIYKISITPDNHPEIGLRFVCKPKFDPFPQQRLRGVKPKRIHNKVIETI